MGSFFVNIIFPPIFVYHVYLIVILLECYYSHLGSFLSLYLCQLVPVVAIFSFAQNICM